MVEYGQQVRKEANIRVKNDLFLLTFWIHNYLSFDTFLNSKCLYVFTKGTVERADLGCSCKTRIRTWILISTSHKASLWNQCWLLMLIGQILLKILWGPSSVRNLVSKNKVESNRGSHLTSTCIVCQCPRANTHTAHQTRSCLSLF